MATLVIKELKSDRELDHGAMTCVTGGSFSYATQTGTSSTLNYSWGRPPGTGSGGYGFGAWSYAAW